MNEDIAISTKTTSQTLLEFSANESLPAELRNQAEVAMQMSNQQFGDFMDAPETECPFC